MNCFIREISTPTKRGREGKEKEEKKGPVIGRKTNGKKKEEALIQASLRGEEPKTEKKKSLSAKKGKIIELGKGKDADWKGGGQGKEKRRAVALALCDPLKGRHRERKVVS